MCGIIGYIGHRKASDVVLHGLKRLEYRGYDSYGIAMLDDELLVIKEKGKISEISGFGEISSFAGIGHTRWATHGMPSRENAHPHFDCRKEIVIAHNGIISNYASLKSELISRGHKFSSDTDTEVIAHLIEESYESGKHSLESAAVKAAKLLKGTYAVVVISKLEKEKLIVFRKESPLVLGIGKGEMFVGSDISAFLKYTKKAVPLDDFEYAVITKEGFEIKSLKTGEKIAKKVLAIDWSEEQAEKLGYEHFMLKEIHEQPQIIKNVLNIYDEDIKKLARMINEAWEKNLPIYIIGAGTSLHAAMVAQYWFSKLCEVQVIAADSSEFLEIGVVKKGSLVIGITQSGETYDTLSAMRYAKSKGARLAAIVNVIGSTATREAEHIVMQNSGMEIAVCATKTFMGQITALLRTAIELGKIRNKDERRIKEIEKGLEKAGEYVAEVLKKENEVKKIAEKYCTVKNYIYIGRGITLPIAFEGALKFKEVTYLHAEAMSSGLLKHGTISLIDKNMRTIAVIPSKSENREKIMNNIQEVKARGGVVVGITSGTEVETCDVNLVAPECHEMLSPIVLIPFCQLLAYYAAVKLGRDVDKPRALAKSVTVE